MKITKTDIMAGIGVALVSGGAGLIFFPLAPIVLGAVITYLAWKIT